MLLELNQDYTKNDTLESLEALKPLTLYNATILDIPSQSELLLLSANLLYVGARILRGEIQESEVHVMQYNYKALELLKIHENYLEDHLTWREFKQIKKEFKLKKYYDNE